MALRTGLFDFLESLLPIANLYIRTNSNKEYAYGIVSKIINKHKEYIPLSNVYAILPTTNDHKESKDLS